MKKLIYIFILLIIFTDTALYAETKKSRKSSSKKKSSSVTQKGKKASEKKSKKKSTALALYKMPKVRALVVTRGMEKRIQVIAMTDTYIEYADGLKRKNIPLASIESITFEVGYYPATIRILEAQKKYIEAASEILKKFTPALKYITIPENNIVDPLFYAGFLYLDAGLAFDQKDSPDFDKEKAIKAYKNAYKVFRKITTAKWYENVRFAEINAIYCVIRMGKYDIAKKRLKAFEPPPEPGDPSYGLYWLIDSMIKFKENKKEEALDSAVKSIVFDCKNTYSFPKALLISAFCYEDLLDYYRALDTYFEVACLFEGTPEGDIAYKSIKFIRDRKLTDEQEEPGLEKVFFDSVEDVNKKVDDYIAKRDKYLKDQERRLQQKNKKETENE